MNMESTVNFVDLTRICRTCLTKTGTMKSLFGPAVHEGGLESEVSTIAEELGQITSKPVEVSDGLPLQVCEPCVSLIHSAYKFKLRSDHSLTVLKEYILNEAKSTLEPEDDSEADNHSADESFSYNLGNRLTWRKHVDKPPIGDVDTAVKGRRTRQIPKKKEDSCPEDCRNEHEAVMRLHPCPVCTMEFTALELREHAHTHTALKKYLSIPAAHRVRPTARFYHRHDPSEETVSIHNKELKLHECVLCHVELTASDLRLHLENHRNQKEFRCDQCERVFRKMNHLNTHRVKHLKEFPFKCGHCGKGFVIKTNYDCHVLTHDANQELPHECPHCLRRFSNPEHLNRHVIIHTENVSYSVKYRVCKCHHCLKTFKDRDELKTHECTPVERPTGASHPCKICNKVFKNLSGLYNHKRNIHKLKGAKVLCSVCGNYVSNIYTHMMRHSGEKPFQCNQCGKRFAGKPQLKQHLLVHSGLKPFVCSMCAKAFNNLYNLQVHERIHVGDRCHVCNVCNKGFLEKSYLKKHMNVHSKVP